MAARLTLTQEVVVRIHDPEPQMKRFMCIACNTAPSSNWLGGRILNPEMSVRVRQGSPSKSVRGGTGIHIRFKPGYRED